MIDITILYYIHNKKKDKCKLNTNSKLQNFKEHRQTTILIVKEVFDAVCF